VTGDGGDLGDLQLPADLHPLGRLAVQAIADLFELDGGIAGRLAPYPGARLAAFARHVPPITQSAAKTCGISRSD
jgi:hypothetical protein